MNCAGALLTAAVVGWFGSLYFAVRSLRHYGKLSRSKNKKARQKRILRWSALALIAVPVVLSIVWFALGRAIQFVTAPATQTVPITGTMPLGIGYWSATDSIAEVLIALLPFCLIVAVYLTVKRSRL